MELGTASILVQLLLIFALAAVFTGRRYLRARRESRSHQPRGAAPPTSPAPSMQVPLAPAPQLVDLPPLVRRSAGTPEAQSLVSEELLPPCFADTCADWTQLDPTPARPVPSAMSCTIAPQVRHCA